MNINNLGQQLKRQA